MSHETVDHNRVLVQPRRLGEAYDYVESHELLGGLARNDQHDAALIIAQLMTVLDMELMLQEIGRQGVKVAELEDTGKLKDKAIILMGTKVGHGVDIEGCVTDISEARKVFGD